MSVIKKNFKKFELVCEEGEDDQTLYLVEKGTLLVFGVEGTKITPFAYIGADEFVGELSFFDKERRSAFVIAMDNSELIVIPTNMKEKFMPDWLIKFAINATKRIRHIDNLISRQGIKRKNADTIKPLSIELQRQIFTIINK